MSGFDKSQVSVDFHNSNPHAFVTVGHPLVDVFSLSRIVRETEYGIQKPAIVDVAGELVSFLEACEGLGLNDMYAFDTLIRKPLGNQLLTRYDPDETMLFANKERREVVKTHFDELGIKSAISKSALGTSLQVWPTSFKSDVWCDPLTYLPFGSFNKQFGVVRVSENIFTLVARAFQGGSAFPQRKFVEELKDKYSGGIDSSLTLGNFKALLPRLIEQVNTDLARNRVEVNKGNQTRYLDYAACLASSSGVTVYMNDNLSFMPEFSDPKNPEAAYDGYARLVRENVDSNFIFALVCAQVVIESRKHFLALKRVWESAPINWFYHYVYGEPNSRNR